MDELCISDVLALSQGTVSATHSLEGENPKIEDARIVLLSLHDSMDETQCESVKDFYAGSRAEYLRFLQIGRDVGARELTNDLVRSITGAVALHVELPRSIIDLNRLSSYAVGVPLPAELATQEYPRLLALHERATCAIRLLLSETPNARVVLDVHTMSPGAPKVRPPRPSCNTLGEDVAAWREASLYGERRGIDLIDSLEDGSVIGNRVLSLDLADAFAANDLSYAFNAPYAKSPANHPLDFISGFGKSGISIDIPKDLIAHTPGMAFDIAECEPNEKGVSDLAAVIREGILKHL